MHERVHLRRCCSPVTTMLFAGSRAESFSTTERNSALRVVEDAARAALSRASSGDGVTFGADRRSTPPRMALTSSERSGSR